MQKEIVLGNKVKILNEFFKQGEGEQKKVGPSLENGPKPKEKGSGRKMPTKSQDQAEQNKK